MADTYTPVDNAALIKEVNELHKHKKHPVSYHVQTVVAVIVTIVMLFPLYWMIATSFKSAEEVQLVIPTGTERQGLSFYEHVLGYVLIEME